MQRIIYLLLPLGALGCSPNTSISPPMNDLPMTAPDLPIRPDMCLRVDPMPLRGTCPLQVAFDPVPNVAAGTPDVLAMQATINLPEKGPAHSYNICTSESTYLGEYPCQDAVISQFTAKMLGTSVPDLGGYVRFIDTADTTPWGVCYPIAGPRLKSGDTLTFNIVSKCAWAAGADTCADKPLSCGHGRMIVTSKNPQKVALRVNGATTKSGQTLQIGTEITATGETTGESLSLRPGPTAPLITLN